MFKRGRDLVVGYGNSHSNCRGSTIAGARGSRAETYNSLRQLPHAALTPLNKKQAPYRALPA